MASLFSYDTQNKLHTIIKTFIIYGVQTTLNSITDNNVLL